MKKLLALIIILVLALALNTIAHAQDQWQARVVDVTDGDTIVVEPINGGDRVKIRLWGIDCPETDQPYGMSAKGFVSDLLLFKQVLVAPHYKDRYKRLVATVYYFDVKARHSVQEALLRTGYAWLWPRYCKDADPCNRWAGLQQEAKSRQFGFWKDTNPIPPWEWRKGKK